MIQNALRLDSFGAEGGFRDIGYQSALNDAYRKGLADGRKQAEDSQLARLTAQLEEVAAGLQADEAARAEQMAAGTQAFRHALAAIVDELVPLHGREKLIEELTFELERAAKDRPDRHFTIRCNTALKGQVDRIIQENPSLSATIQTVEEEGFAVSIVADNGRSSIDIDGHAAFIRNILKNRQGET